LAVGAGRRAAQDYRLLIVVDSSTWADFFNGTDDPWVLRLDEALVREEDLAVLPIIVTEVLQGLRTERGFREARMVLTAMPSIRPALDTHVRAAELFRSLRSQGVTIRGAIDCVIAQTCIDLDATLLSPDRDFQRIASHAPLNLWRPASP